MNLSDEETQSVKKVATALLNTLKAERLVLDWKKRSETRAGVQVTIEQVLDEGLPPKFDEFVYPIKCKSVFDHVFDSYMGQGASIYDTAEAS